MNDQPCVTYNVQEDLLLIMEDRGVNKAELARRLNQPRSYVTRLFSIDNSMTLRTLNSVCVALGGDIRVSAKPMERK